MQLTKWTRVEFGHFSVSLVIFGRVGLVSDEGVEQRLVGRCQVGGLALQACLHAIVEKSEEVAIVDTVADGNVVPQCQCLVRGGRRRLGGWCTLCKGVSR